MHKLTDLFIILLLIIIEFNLTYSTDPEDIKDLSVERHETSRLVKYQNTTHPPIIQEPSTKFLKLKPGKISFEGKNISLLNKILQSFRSKNCTNKSSDGKRIEYCPKPQYRIEDVLSFRSVPKTTDDTVIEEKVQKTDKSEKKSEKPPSKPPRGVLRTFSDVPPKQEMKKHEIPISEIKSKKSIEEFNLTYSTDPEDIKDFPVERHEPSRFVKYRNPAYRPIIQELSAKFVNLKSGKMYHDGPKSLNSLITNISLPKQILKLCRNGNCTNKSSEGKRKDYHPKHQYLNQDVLSFIIGSKENEATKIVETSQKTHKFIIKRKSPPPKPPRSDTRTFYGVSPKRETIKNTRQIFEIRPKKLIKENRSYRRHQQNELTLDEKDN